MRRVIFQNGEFYHIYNRGVERRNIFCDEDDYQRFLSSLKGLNNNLGESQRNYLKKAGCFLKSDVNFPKSDVRKLTMNNLNLLTSDFRPLIKIIAYCSNPNHYHLLVEQLVGGGITLFMRKLGTSYTKYFNIKHNRPGHLFQGKFQAISIKTVERLIWLSAYINGNPEIHKMARAENYQWSSDAEYLNDTKNSQCDKKIILERFENVQGYQDFVSIVIRDSREFKEEDKKYLLE